MRVRFAHTYLVKGGIEKAVCYAQHWAVHRAMLKDQVYASAQLLALILG